MEQVRASYGGRGYVTACLTNESNEVVLVWKTPADASSAAIEQGKSIALDVWVVTTPYDLTESLAMQQDVQQSAVKEAPVGTRVASVGFYTLDDTRHGLYIPVDDTGGPFSEPERNTLEAKLTAVAAVRVRVTAGRTMSAEGTASTP